jgi:hypothetical protein
MDPSINLSQPLFDELAGLAEPFVDREPQDVIKRLIDHWHSSNTSVRVHGLPAVDAVRTFSADNPPNMSFTRVKSFTMDGTPVVEKAALYWNPILVAIVARAASKLDKEVLKRKLAVNYLDGEGPKERGYRFIKEAGLSVQGSDANTVWRAIYALVRAIGMSIDVEFAWEDKPGAAHPNTTGRFVYDGQ